MVFNNQFQGQQGGIWSRLSTYIGSYYYAPSTEEGAYILSSFLIWLEKENEAGEDSESDEFYSDDSSDEFMSAEGSDANESKSEEVCESFYQSLPYQESESSSEPEPEPESEPEENTEEGPMIEDEAASFFDDEEDIECTLYRVRLGMIRMRNEFNRTQEREDWSFMSPQREVEVEA